MTLDARRKTMDSSIDGVNFLTSPKNEFLQQNQAGGNEPNKKQVSSHLMGSRGSTRPSVDINLTVSHLDAGSHHGVNMSASNTLVFKPRK